MKLKVNGEIQQLSPVKNLDELLEQLGYRGSYFAVAVNHACIPRSAYSNVALHDGDTVEIVAPMQGG